MACLLAFMHGSWKQSATDVRRWIWIGKGREGRGAVVRVWIRKLGELWVVAEALALEWKRGRRQGYGCACLNLVVAEVLARTPGRRIEQQMVHINDSYLSLCLCPPNCVSCLTVMEPGTGGGVAMVNREAQRPHFCLMGWVGVGEAMNPRKERGAGRRHAHIVETGRGAVCGHSVVWNYYCSQVQFSPVFCPQNGQPWTTTSPGPTQILREPNRTT